ncbi:MAG: saccharopine dehydrogenase C-terminal domain-containing protein, partial [Bacteroidota bacterium]
TGLGNLANIDLGITQPGKYWENGEWIETEPHAIKREVNYPDIGPKMSYLIYHEELESLTKHYPSLKRARFWMTFGEEYLTHLRVIQNIGMAGIEPVNHKGVDIIPIEFLKTVLPDPGELGENYTGQTSIGCRIRGIKNGKEQTAYVWNNCSHAAAYQETGAQGVSYTTGVPAMTGAMMLLTGKWTGAGVFNVEQFDPDPFLDKLGLHGLEWHEEIGGDIEFD